MEVEIEVKSNSIEQVYHLLFGESTKTKWICYCWQHELRNFPLFRMLFWIFWWFWNSVELESSVFFWYIQLQFNFLRVKCTYTNHGWNPCCLVALCPLLCISSESQICAFEWLGEGGVIELVRTSSWRWWPVLKLRGRMMVSSIWLVCRVLPLGNQDYNIMASQPRDGIFLFEWFWFCHLFLVFISCVSCCIVVPIMLFSPFVRCEPL